MKKVFSFYMTISLIDKVREVAKKERRSLVQMIEWILDNFLKNYDK
jgi:hypothetical protein